VPSSDHHHSLSHLSSPPTPTKLQSQIQHGSPATQSQQSSPPASPSAHDAADQSEPTLAPALSAAPLRCHLNESSSKFLTKLPRNSSFTVPLQHRTSPVTDRSAQSVAGAAHPSHTQLCHRRCCH
jgi:hypothetical protein